MAIGPALPDLALSRPLASVREHDVARQCCATSLPSGVTKSTTGTRSLTFKQQDRAHSRVALLIYWLRFARGEHAWVHDSAYAHARVAIGYARSLISFSISLIEHEGAPARALSIANNHTPL